MPGPVCIIGDSISGGVIYLPDTERYVHCPESFINLLGTETGAEIRNHSKFGCTVTMALKQIDRFQDDIAACPQTFIMLGGNDSDFDWSAVADSPELPHECKTPPSVFTTIYNKLLDRIIALGSKPVLLDLIPVDGNRYFRWFSKKSDPSALMRFLKRPESIEHWNEMYSLAVMKIAVMRCLPLLDVRSSFLRTRNFDDLFSEDGIHPSPKGHRAMFEYILPQAQKILL